MAKSWFLKFWRGLLILLMLGTASLLSPPKTAHACTYAGPFYELADLAQLADYVVEGTVIEAIPNETGVARTASVAVRMYLKSSGQQPVVIEAGEFGSGRGDCLARIESGETYIFFLNHIDGNQFEAQYPMPGSAIRPSNSNAIIELLHALGTSPTLTTIPEDIQIAQDEAVWERQNYIDELEQVAAQVEEIQDTLDFVSTNLVDTRLALLDTQADLEEAYQRIEETETAYFTAQDRIAELEAENLELHQQVLAVSQPPAVSTSTVVLIVGIVALVIVQISVIYTNRRRSI